ncbi:MAG: hypothetical protein K2I56_07265 [Muribaculaceae bacterium]|nr:hypothetical protein [Muribaculaceae bacterium]
MTIDINGHILDTAAPLSIDIEDLSPVFNDMGSQSVPVTVPATPANAMALGFPQLLHAGSPADADRRCTAVLRHGVYCRSGVVNLQSAGFGEGLTFNIGFDDGEAYSRWADRRLSELSGLPTLRQSMQGALSEREWIFTHLDNLYRNADPQTDALAVFPLLVDKESGLQLNRAKGGKLVKITTVTGEINGETTEVSVPENYGVTPFVRVWAVLEYIFKDLGLELKSNPFRYYASMARLVVLNNIADAACRTELAYADLMPDCTVQEFLSALWCRFGLVCHCDFSHGEARLLLIRDIIDRSEQITLDPMLTGWPLINYNDPQYVKISAGTSIEGAEPQVERFEDFARGCDTTRLHTGHAVENWVYNPERDRWDGDVRDDFYEMEEPEDPDRDFPENPEPDEDDRGYGWIDDRDDRDDFDQWDDWGYDFAMLAAAAPTSAQSGNGSLAREFITGRFSRLDSENGRTTSASSPFFNWDPQPEGLEALELESPDECVPVVSVGVDYMPAYLYGPRHYHSYIKGSDSEESGETPLAFMMAYTNGLGTVGRNSPETADGAVMPCVSRDPGFTLYAQFRRGLFDTFWRQYDELLRHGNRTVEVSAMVPLRILQGLDLLRPVKLHGIRCLIERMAYTLSGAGADVAVDFTLRTINTTGNYDIQAEQGLPQFRMWGNLTWRYVDDTLAAAAELSDNRRRAAEEWIRKTGYTEHGVQGDFYFVDYGSATVEALSDTSLAWRSDVLLGPPGAPGLECRRNYSAKVRYEIYEIHEIGYLELEPGDKLGSIVIEVPYTMTLKAVWQSD